MRPPARCARDLPADLVPEVEEVRALMATARTPYVRVATERWELELRRG